MVRTMDDLVSIRRPATLVDWVSYPDRLTFDQAAFLVGQPVEQVAEWANTAAVDAWDGPDGSTLIDKASLREFWEIYWELADYMPG